MLAKALKQVDRLIMIVAENRLRAMAGWRNSIVEAYTENDSKPQGGSHPPQSIFSPVRKCRCGRRDCNVCRSQQLRARIGKSAWVPSGFEAVAWVKRNVIELGRPSCPQILEHPGNQKKRDAWA